MKKIELLMKALTENDYDGISELFSEDCVYFDYCPSMNGMANSYMYGKAGVNMYFRKLFVTRQLKVGEPLIESDNSATYFGAYGGPYVYARLNIEEYDSDGLIKKVVAHPA